MFKDKISKEVVRERLKYPYEIKVRMTERRLRLITNDFYWQTKERARHGRKDHTAH